MCRTLFVGCSENTEWETVTGNFKCSDYAANRWCENGGIGSAWNPSWNWLTGSNGLDARSACCICGGGGRYQEQLFEDLFSSEKF